MTILQQNLLKSNGNVILENFMHMEWSEEKFLKGIVGDERRLRFWNKHQKIELSFMQLARYNRLHERVLKYQKKNQTSWLINQIYQDIKLILYFPC